MNEDSDTLVVVIPQNQSEPWSLNPNLEALMSFNGEISREKYI